MAGALSELHIHNIIYNYSKKFSRDLIFTDRQSFNILQFKLHVDTNHGPYVYIQTCLFPGSNFHGS